jgi:hypothetical protein
MAPTEPLPETYRYSTYILYRRRERLIAKVETREGEDGTNKTYITRRSKQDPTT